MILLLFALALSSPGQDAPSPCDLEIASAAGGGSCARSGHGVALAKDQANADALAAHAQAGEDRFQTYFARDISPYAVTSVSPAPNSDALQAAGFTHVLPWPDPEVFEQATRQGIERAARQFAASQGLDVVQADQMVERALANSRADGGKAALDAGMVPHELGHLWFTQAFWPAGEVDPLVSHYGGPGPDWLDELAAILLEDEPTTLRRREQLRALLSGEVVPAIGPAAGRDTLLDLKGFLARDHPALSRVIKERPEMPASGGIAMVYTPAGGGLNAVVAERLFYIQARAFADFMIERTGRATVFADIAQGLSEGRSFESWLASEGTTLGLPPTLNGLDTLWRIHLHADATVGED
ncbi:MAG: hypothetical protein EON86_05225 [Brevundimonas sp.]|nr:MAG: hypothetical protein EON86_05225 [Brevundimonas sp.]